MPKIKPTLNSKKRKVSPVSSKTKSENEFERVLAEIESPQDWGNGSWALPEKELSSSGLSWNSSSY